MWQIGDIVICINNQPLDNKRGKHPKLILGRKYIIYDIFECSCGHLTFDVGLQIDANEQAVICTCDKLFPHKGIHWCYSERFKKLTSNNSEDEVAQEELLKEALKIIEKENV